MTSQASLTLAEISNFDVCPNHLPDPSFTVTVCSLQSTSEYSCPSLFVHALPGMPFSFVLPPTLRRQEAECAYVLLVVAILWITESLPLSITALLPGLMFPMFGIMKSSS
ncbi:hypothetical protein STEG23_005367, partial [Scotinomys teguina]